MAFLYIAGPLFSESERWFDEQIAKVCEDLGHKTFLPHRDAGLQESGNADALYAEDVTALCSANLVVANLDGVDVDAGTAWEIGYAVARRTLVIGVRTDRRVLEPWARVNLMIERSVMIVSSLDDLRAKLREMSKRSFFLHQEHLGRLLDFQKKKGV